MIPRAQHQADFDPSFDLSRGFRFRVEGSKSFVLSAERSFELFRQQARRLGAVLSESANSEHEILVRETAEVVGPESYTLSVLGDRVDVEASASAGVFWATQSLLQLLSGSGKICGVHLRDAPRFSWRGAHLDVARHFFPVSFIQRFLDWMALHKLNVFHFHLTEDQGWRIQLDAFPRLTEVGSVRNGPSGAYGGYYTKAEIREIVEYARERHILVVPEIEMPGHAIAALAAYPELSCTSAQLQVETRWGIFDDVFCVGNDQTIQFLERVIDEVVELFDSEYFHIGGDECPKTRWRSCPRCQARISDLGLKNEDELQSWFVSRMSQYLAAKGKRLVGWDEILEGGLADGATVMSWRGVEGGIRAAKMGHDVVMSPTSHCYLDYKQSSNEDEAGAWFAPPIDLETAYLYEPIPRELSGEERSRVLGLQGNLWSERMPTESHVEYMAFPRLCALAEVGWSGPEKNYSDFLRRLEPHLALLDRLGVRYRGSAFAEPVRPTVEERKQFERAAAERARKGQNLSAYS